VVIDALYRASQAGVPIDIWVRGICALRPGIPGLSETIRVRSVLGRFLEHSRIYAFGTGDPYPDEPADARISANEVWLGSPDMMHRNLDRRVEVLVKVTDPVHARRLRGLIDRGMAQTTASWWLAPDGTWERRSRDADGSPLFDVQERLITKRRVRGTAREDAPQYPPAGNG
jgi:polyphosphate kinase